eukprot:831442-Amphidinium_carterae.1
MWRQRLAATPSAPPPRCSRHANQHAHVPLLHALTFVHDMGGVHTCMSGYLSMRCAGLRNR